MKLDRVEAATAVKPTPAPKAKGPRTSAIAWRDELIIDLLWRLSRMRHLTIEEQTILGKAEHRQRQRQPRKNKVWRWNPEEDRKLRTLIRKRERNGGPKVFQPNNEVRDMAEAMGRTYMATLRRMERLRKTVKPARKVKG